VTKTYDNVSDDDLIDLFMGKAALSSCVRGFGPSPSRSDVALAPRGRAGQGQLMGKRARAQQDIDVPPTSLTPLRPMVGDVFGSFEAKDAAPLFKVPDRPSKTSKAMAIAPTRNVEIAAALQSQLLVREAPTLRDAVNFDESRTTPIHRWFRYREGFSPAIFDMLSEARRVFDPFCGCGTTLIEAKRRGISAIGTDVNPLAVFVAKTKTRNYTAKHRRKFEAWARHSMQCLGAWPAPKMPLLPKLFHPEALSELLRLRMGLEECEDREVRDLLRLCWLSILESSANVFKEGNGLKYRNKKRQPGQYITIPDEIWIPRYFGSSIRNFVRQRWHDQCLFVSKDLASPAKREPLKIEILERSCLDAAIKDEVRTCDASLFSPPYANRFDYFEAFKIELWMGNFVSSSEEMRQLRNRSIRNNLTVQTGKVRQRADLEDILNLMDDSASSVRMGIRETLRGYFEDISLLATNLRAVLKPGAKVLCVVGNSAYAGVLIPTDLLCATIFRDADFKVQSIEVARHLHVRSQQRSKMVGGLQPYMRESVIVCQR
jgi:hypothetical protein